jgi:hypothetical protein
MVMKWKNVLGFEKQYEVSNTGIIRSKTRNITYIQNSKTVTRTFYSRLLKPKFTWDGYYEVTLQSLGKRKYVRLHRVIFEAFNDKIPNGLVINHKDGNKLNNNLNNLEVVTVAENNAHALKNKLYITAKGEQSSILTNSQVLEIRARVSNGEVQRKVAKEYGVGKNCIWHIVNRTTWRHI